MDQFSKEDRSYQAALYKCTYMQNYVSRWTWSLCAETSILMSRNFVIK